MLFLQKWISALGAISFILFPLHFPSRKRRKNWKEEGWKRRKNRRKRGKKKAFSFPFLSPFLFKKRKGSRKRNGFLLAPFSSIIPLKREEKKQKEGKKRRKRSFFHFSLILISYPHFPKRAKIKKKKWKKICALPRSFQTKKRPHFIFRWNKVFSILLFKISHIEDKDFYLGRDKSKLREQVYYSHSIVPMGLGVRS